MQRSTTSQGRQAETVAARYLEAKGFVILARNWRNRWCELDIVAERFGEIHFIEVKYRKTAAYGMAVEYITHDKQARLARAAAAWCQANHYRGSYQIGAIGVEGDLSNPSITYIPELIFG